MRKPLGSFVWIVKPYSKPLQLWKASKNFQSSLEEIGKLYLQHEVLKAQIHNFIVNWFKGKWRYLVQQSDNDIQQIETIVCQKNEKTTCRTEDFDDAPKDSTTCKQIFSTRKLLAVDENGVVSVDSFQLPSACLCRYTLVRNGF